MYIAVHHSITDRDQFWQILDELSQNSIAGAKVHRILRNEPGDRAVTLWEADSLEAARNHLESRLGPVSGNEYELVESARAWGVEPEVA